MKRPLSWILIGILACSMSLAAQAPKAQTPPPDNTKTNKVDRDQGKATAGQQKENRSDLEITQKIRRAITSDKALSTYAKNIKIITQNGDVTLRGPVRSEEDKRALETKASEVVGGSHVKNEIQVVVKPAKKTS
jgi:hyperosmotically inducible protein